jgi:hypothetical protein
MSLEFSELSVQISVASRPTWGLNCGVLNSIYRCAVAPLVLYCVPAFCRILDKKMGTIQAPSNPGALHIMHLQGLSNALYRSRLSYRRHSPVFLTSILKAQIRIKKGRMSGDINIPQPAHVLSSGHLATVQKWSPYHLSFCGATGQIGPGRFYLENYSSYSDTPHSVGLLWTSDQPDAETST